MSVLVFGACIVTVFVAGMLQRLTGIGYALVASPVLIVAVGPDEAVRLVIVTSLASSTLALAATRKSCQPGQVALLLLFAVLAIWPAALLFSTVSSSLSSLLAGVVVLAALAVALHPSGIAVPSKWGQAAVAGILSGAMNAVAALGGPMAATYGIGQRWGASMVPNLQLFLLTTSFVVLGVRGWPVTTSSLSVAILALSAVTGVLLAGQLAQAIDIRHARLMTVVIAVLGATVAIGRGLWHYI